MQDEADQPLSRSQRVALKLSSLFYEALLAFKMRILCFPKHLFIFTNRCQRVKTEDEES